MRPRTVLFLTGVGGLLLLTVAILWLLGGLGTGGPLPESHPPARRPESAAGAGSTGPLAAGPPARAVQQPSHDEEPQRLAVSQGESAGDGRPLAKSTRSVSGRVTDMDGLPLAGATITLDAAHNPLTAISDEGGRFGIQVPPAYAGLLECRLEGFVAPRPIRVLAGEWLALTLSPGHTLDGEVVDSETGAPIAGARVRPNSKPGSPSAWTDPAGRFRLSGLREGPVTVTVRARGYESTSRAGLMVGNSRSSPSRIELTRGLPCSGTVSEDRTHRPIAGARVIHEPISGASHLLSTTVVSDAAGRFSFEAIGLERTLLRVEADGYLPATRRNLEALDPTRPIDITLRVSAHIDGIVRTGQGGAIAGARVAPVTTRSPGAGGPGETITGDNGVFSLDGLDRRRRYTLVINHPAHAPALVSRVRADVAGDPISIVLTPAARVTGTVHTLQGEALPGATVVLTFPALAAPLLGGRPLVRVADDEGRYSFEGLPPGRFFVMVRAAHLTTDAVPLDLTEGKTQDVPLILEPSERVGGIVVDEAGRPLPGAFVRASTYQATPDGVQAGRTVGWTWSIGSVLCDSNGRFTLAGARRGESVHLEARAAEHAPVDLDIPAGQTDVRIELAAYGRVHGQVIDAATGAPIPCFAVDLSDRPDTQRMHGFKSRDGNYCHQISNPSGTFTLSRVAAGTYTLRVHADDYRMSAWIPITPQVGDGPERALRIALQAGGTLHGLVTLAGGAPAAGIPVFARLEGPSGTYMTTVVEQTSRDGTYRMGNLATGRWMLGIGAPDDPEGVPESVEIATDSLLTRDLEVRLGTLDLDVRNSFDQPVAGAAVLARMTKSGMRRACRVRATTDKTGRARLEGLLPGRWSVLVRKTATFVSFEVLIEEPSTIMRTVNMPGD